MFPINFNFPYRKKDGSIITMQKALDGAGADLDLVDLDDVAITNPAEGELFQYNGTTEKWENSSVIPDKLDDEIEARATLGAHNLLPITMDNLKVNNTSGTWDGNAYTYNGITYTVNFDDKGGVAYIDANGTLGEGENSTFYIQRSTIGTFVNFGNANISSDTKAHATVSGYIMSLFGDDTYNSDNYMIYNGSNSGMYILLQKTVDHVQLKPMMRLETDHNTDYVPYAMTNRELTDQIKYKNALDAGIDISGYTENNKYRIPKEGYIRYRIPSEKTNVGVIVYGSNISNTTRYINDYFPSTTMEIRSSIYVKEGMYAYCVGEVAEALFFGLS